MNKIIFLLITFLALGCSTEKEQLETLREVAKQDLIIQLQLPEGTVFNDEDLVITPNATALEKIGMIYVVKATIRSQDANGNEILKSHTLKYQKLGRVV